MSNWYEDNEEFAPWELRRIFKMEPIEKASPVEMRKALEIVDEFKKGGILFVPMPVKGIEDKNELIAQMLCRIESLLLMAEKEEACCDSPGKDRCDQCQETGSANPTNH